MNRLLIIDGHNLHFQIFFGIRSKQKKRPGYPVKFGESFTGSLKRIIRAASPTHVVVVFDGEHENPRRALFPAYKANRPDYDLLPDEENPYLQLPAAFEALEKLGVKYIETTRLEADDLIALCAERFKSAAQVIVCSHDHDFYQLICPQVKIMNYSGKQGTYYGEAAFRDEFHISPRRFADYKALTGDKSDNIPGIRGVGSITAARLLNRFGGVEDIIAHTGEVRQKKLRRCLVEGVERMRLNYKLVKLGGEQYGEVELPWKLSELEFSLSEEKKRGRGRGAKSQTAASVGQNEQTAQNPKNPRGASAANSPKGPDNAKNTKNPGNQKNIRDPQKEQAAKSAAPDEVISAPGKTPDQPRKPRNQRRRRSSKRNHAQNQAIQNQIEQNQTAQNQAAQPQTVQIPAQDQAQPPKQPSKSSKKKQNQPKKQSEKALEQKQNQPPKQTAKAPEQKQDQPRKPKQNQQKNRQTKPNERQRQSPEQNQNNTGKQNQPRKPGYDRKKPRRDDFALDFDSNEPIGNRIQTRKPMWLGGDDESASRD